MMQILMRVTVLKMFVREHKINTQGMLDEKERKTIQIAIGSR